MPIVEWQTPQMVSDRELTVQKVQGGGSAIFNIQREEIDSSRSEGGIIAQRVQRQEIQLANVKS
jgi:hypothetical protein